MAKQLMNEAERFLLEHWAEARRLEESMDGVRTKYKEVFQRIIDAVTEAHPEFDASAAYPTQFWGEGYVGFGRKNWPGGDSNWPSGPWVWGVRLEMLADESCESPSAYLYFSHKSKLSIDSEAARGLIKKEAKALLSPEDCKRVTDGDSNNVLVYLPAPSKSELLSLLADGDGQRFVELFVSQFDMMARFVPVLDKVFGECLTKE